MTQDSCTVYLSRLHGNSRHSIIKEVLRECGLDPLRKVRPLSKDKPNFSEGPLAFLHLGSPGAILLFPHPWCSYNFFSFSYIFLPFHLSPTPLVLQNAIWEVFASFCKFLQVLCEFCNQKLSLVSLSLSPLFPLLRAC